MSGAATFAVLMALAWLAASALTQMDTRGAQSLRIHLGMERSGQVCGAYDQPTCTYDDGEQRRMDREDRYDRAVRTVVLTELESRIESQVAHLAHLRTRVAESDPSRLIFWADDPEVQKALDPAVDLSPLADRATELEAMTRLRLAARSSNETFLDAIDLRLTHLHDLLGRVHMVSAREGAVDRISKRRVATLSVLNESKLGPELAKFPHLQSWLDLDGPNDDLSSSTASLLRSDAKRLAEGISGEGRIWHNALGALAFVDEPYQPSAKRYASPVEAAPRWRLFGLALFAMAAFSLLVISPTITATETAKEREAGTLPVLRMTGMSADDLAAAMIAGPNVFSWVLAASSLALALPILAITVGPHRGLPRGPSRSSCRWFCSPSARPPCTSWPSASATRSGNESTHSSSVPWSPSLWSALASSGRRSPHSTSLTSVSCSGLFPPWRQRHPPGRSSPAWGSTFMRTIWGA